MRKPAYAETKTQISYVATTLINVFFFFFSLHSYCSIYSFLILNVKPLKPTAWSVSDIVRNPATGLVMMSLK